MNQEINTQHPDPQGEREKFVMAFNDTMLKIWQEQITLLDVIDTGHLLHSVKALPVRADGRYIEIGLSQLFTEYGLWTSVLAKKYPVATTGILVERRSAWLRSGSPRSIIPLFSTSATSSLITSDSHSSV